MKSKPKKIIALQDRNKHNKPPYAYGICKIFVQCKRMGGEFVQNSETTETRYFALDALPEHLAEEKTTKAQIELCFQAVNDPCWQPVFDSFNTDLKRKEAF